MGFSEKHPTLHERVNEIAHAVAIGSTSIEDHVDLDAVGKSHGGAGRVERELVQQIPRQLAGIGGEDGFQFVDVLETAAIPQLARRINGSASV